MNLSWGLFDVSRNALGGWWPFEQAGTILFGVLLTLKFARSQKVAMEAEHFSAR
jgi:hypothetical protein